MSLALPLILLLLSFVIIGVVIERTFIPCLENIARWLNLSESIAGATLLAFGSSAPELFTALVSMVLIGTQPSFGVGSIIGSALFQILVVIGFAAVVKTTQLRWRPVLRDGAAYCLAVLMVYGFARDGVFTRLEGLLLVGAYCVYLFGLMAWSRHVSTGPGRDPWKGDDTPAESADGHSSPFGIFTAPIDILMRPVPDPKRQPAWTVPLFLASLAVIGGCAWTFVNSGVRIAQYLGIDPSIIALTVIAGGSSIPELFSSAIVARRGQGDMAIANALGSNTFDIFVSLGLPVLIATLLYGDIEQVGNANVVSSTILLFATLVMVLGLLALQKFRASRPFGIFLMFCYAVYVYAAYRGWLG